MGCASSSTRKADAVGSFDGVVLSKAESDLKAGEAAEEAAKREEEAARRQAEEAAATRLQAIHRGKSAKQRVVPCCVQVCPSPV